MSIVTMTNTGLALIRWVYIMFKACEWFISIVFRQWVFRKKQKKRQKVADDLYDAFGLSEMEPGRPVRLETRGGLTVPMFRKEASK